MSVRVYSVCVALYVGRGLGTDRSPSHGVLATVYRIEKLKKLPKPKKGCRTILLLLLLYCSYLLRCINLLCVALFAAYVQL
jgi:hypothetical protein